MDNSTLGMLVVGFFALAAVLSVRGLIDTGFRFAVDSVTGEVMRERQRSETEVSGSISGGGSGYGGVSGSVSSTTTRSQSIFLRLPSGKETEITFEDFEIPCREGHRLTIVEAAREGWESEVIAYHNHATDQTFPLESSVASIVRPQMGASVAVWGFAAFSLGLIQAWSDGTLQTERGVSFVAACILAVIVGGVAWVVLRVLSVMRGAPRASALRAAVVAHIDQVEAQLEGAD